MESPGEGAALVEGMARAQDVTELDSMKKPYFYVNTKTNELIEAQYMESRDVPYLKRTMKDRTFIPYTGEWKVLEQLANAGLLKSGMDMSDVKTLLRAV